MEGLEAEEDSICKPTRPQSRVDLEYEKINSEKVERSTDGLQGTLLPYLSSMSPSPTFSNLSKVAMDIAHNHMIKRSQPVTVEDGKTADNCSSRSQSADSSDRSSESESHPQDHSMSTKGNFAWQLPQGRLLPGEGAMNAHEEIALPGKYPPGGKTSPFLRAQSVSPEASYLPKPIHSNDEEHPHHRHPVGEDCPPLGGIDSSVGSDQFDNLAFNKLHDLWIEHASHMDRNGRSFLQQLEDLHSQALVDISKIKVYDLKPLLATARWFCEATRSLFVKKVSKSRELEDGFAFTTYKVANDSYALAMQHEIETRDRWYREKVKDMQANHANTLEKARSCALLERTKALESQRAVLERRLDTLVTDVTEKLQAERQEAHMSMVQMEQKLDLISSECEALKVNHKSLKDELQANERWQIKYEKERSKCQTLRNEMAGLSRHHEANQLQVAQNHQNEIQVKEEAIEKLRESMTRVEAKLREEKQLRAKQALAAQLTELNPITGPRGQVPGVSNTPHMERNADGSTPVRSSRRKSFMMDTFQSSARRTSCVNRLPSKQSSFASVSSVTLSLDDLEPPPVGFSQARSPSSLSTGSSVSRLTTHSRPSTSEPIPEVSEHFNSILPALDEGAAETSVQEISQTRTGQDISGQISRSGSVTDRAETSQS